MKKILITGAGGFLGWNLCNIARQSYEVTGIIHNNQISISGVELVRCDLNNFSALKKYFFSISPDVIIHTAAASDPNFCQQQRTEAEKINVDVPAFLATLCGEKSIPFVFTSTDLVFDGKNAPYDELSQVNPVSSYGEQKVLAEIRIKQVYEKSIICRMPLMFGDTPSGSKRFLQLWIDKLLTEKQLSLFTDEFRTPVSAMDAAKGLLLMSEKAQGVIHLGGHERISRYDFGRKLVFLMGMSEKMISACKQDDIKMAAPRPKDVSLDSSKAYALGYNPGQIENELGKLECIRKYHL